MVAEASSPASQDIQHKHPRIMTRGNKMLPKIHSSIQMNLIDSEVDKYPGKQLKRETSS